MKTIFYLSSVACIALMATACTHKKESFNAQATNESIPVIVANLTKSGVQSTLQLSGQLTTDDEATLSFKTGGIIRSMYVKEGDAIRKGQLLATLDLTEIKTQVAQAKLQFEKAQRDFNRISRLYKDSVATLEQFQNSQTGFDIARHQLEASEFNLSFSEIHALKDGYVLKKFVNEGQVITSGTAALLTAGTSSGKWIARCGVSDTDWSRIALNDAAIVSLDAFQEKTFQGVVSRKAESADPASGSFNIDVTMTGNKIPQLATGMFARVNVTPKTSADVWSIPYDAILDGDDKQGYVFITNDGTTARKVAVELGQISKDKVQILSGLENAKQLIVSGNAYLTDSAAIHIVQKP